MEILWKQGFKKCNIFIQLHAADTLKIEPRSPKVYTSKFESHWWNTLGNIVDTNANADSDGKRK